jgi:hypothetical protein
MRLFDRSCLVMLGLSAASLSVVGCNAAPTVSSATPQLQREHSVKKGITSQCPCLYAVTAKPSVTVYPITANGDVAPIEKIIGSKTGLNSPLSVALDAGGNIYVLNTGNDSLTIYASGSNHNVAPIRTIRGNETQMDSPAGMALDPSGNIYVANAGDAAITVYASGASGNVAPINTIEGSYTGLTKPGQLALDASGKIYVPNEQCGYQGHGCIFVYAAGVTGNVAPKQNISGGATKQNQSHVLGEGAGQIYVGAIRRVLGYPATANGNVLPDSDFGPGIVNPGPQGITVDANGNIYVSQRDKIFVYSAGSKALIQTIAGAQTGLDEPQGLAIH